MDHECRYVDGTYHDSGPLDTPGRIPFDAESRKTQTFFSENILCAPAPMRLCVENELIHIMKMPTVAPLARVTLCAVVMSALAMAAAPGSKTFTGIISDDMCARGDHSQMRMAPTDAECTTACVSGHGAAYVLYDGKNVYTLSGRQALDKFAGHKVKVTGDLDEKTQTIRMDSITTAK